ncbi:MmgE/PrpD family protein [Pigmentiphaga litoralis]|uniref:MmgE/PrpD family protein n=1 Tax=Pigmentiphaga litoralis TaxID=516702 RepID=UPI003B42E06E
MITRTLASWVAGLTHDAIPEDVVRTLRLLSLDTFGSALAGRGLPWTDAIEAWAKAGGRPAGSQAATVWGDSQPCLRAADAALVNGAAAHGFELDDFHNAKLHLGAVMLPTVFALAETLQVDSRRAEVALAAGYEVAIRSSLALGPAQARLRGWHLTAVCGPLGSAAAASVMLGLNAERTAWALGLAGTQSSGLYAFSADGTDTKRFHPGRAAQAGVMSAELAAHGLTGPTEIYEAADGGLLRAFVDQPQPDKLLADLGDHWHAPRTNFKPYGCCGSVHAHVDAALALRPDWTGSGVVRVGMPRVVDIQCGYPYQPGSALNAQMSGRYAIAVALLDGAVLPAQFEAARLAGDDVTALANRIEIVADADLDARYPAQFCGWVEVDTRHGGRSRIDVDNPSGSGDNPVGRTAFFRSLRR